MITLSYDRGTIVAGAELPGMEFDARTGQHRAPGWRYRSVAEHLVRNKIAYQDGARQWDNAPMGWKLKTEREPFPHQKEAVEAWWNAGRRGMILLPTGTGKSYVATLAIAKANRPTLVVVPTLDLMRQWQGQLEEAFAIPIGLIGGSEYDIQPITITTYDSAYRHVDTWSPKFGMLVFDEVHHLPGPTYLEAAVCALAPFRLGLTATLERNDGGEGKLIDLVGPVVYRREIQELSGHYLAGYEAKRVYVDLTDEERERYTKCREHYRRFLFESGISLSGPNGWGNFVMQASRTPEGREAIKAWREQKHIERAGEGKFRELERLLKRHASDRTLIFTADNATVYRIARKYLVPPITHQTKTKERKRILERFHSGEYTIVVTSQVLNEGVDVPAAAVGIVLSGTGSTRENVQRLGRILRKHGDKQAVLYEVVARGTGEEFTSERRRQHGAFGSV